MKNETENVVEKKNNLVVVKEWIGSLSSAKASTAIFKEAERIKNKLEKNSKYCDESASATMAIYKSQLEYYQELSKSNDFSQEQRIKFVDEASKILITINELKAKDDKRKRNETIVLFGISVAVAAVSIATNILVSKFPSIKKIKK